MIRNSEHRAPVIYFSQWSRKGYAVFAALGKEVAFATVSINICERALLKSAKKGMCFAGRGYAPDDRDRIPEAGGRDVCRRKRYG